MSSAKQKIVHIKSESEKKTLSTAQKKFNGLIKKIDAQKKLLLEWQDTISVYQRRVSSEYEELWEKYNNHRVELVQLFDTAHSDKLFKQAEKLKLENLIVDISLELVAEHGKEELKELYNKYSGSDFDADNQEQDEAVGQMMKSMLQEMLGIEIGDDMDISSPEKMQAALLEKVQQMQEQQEEKQNKRKKTPKQLEKEAKLEQEEQIASKSIQEVFRKLAAALHPDREQDEVERERKTKIMQQVNVAYGKKDLLRLLELQLEFEHIDQAQLNNMAEDRLKYFNKILQEQLNELQQEIMQVEQMFKLQANMDPFAMLTPKKLLWQLEQDIKDVQKDISKIKFDLDAFKQSSSALKNWLKHYKIPKTPEMPRFDDFDMFFR